MQRLFSTFPAGRPGVGLLLLRMALAGMLSLHVQHSAIAPLHAMCVATFVGAATLIAIGLIIPLAAIVGAIAVAICTIFIDTSHVFEDAFAILTLIALALIGGGAYSLDARLYGRREVLLPDP